jgi:hypothetical protein
MSNVNLEITPSNVLSSGKISFKNGNPVISFIIGEQDRLLIGRSIRLCGKFRGKIDATVAGATSVVAANDNFQASARLGVYGAIDQIVIKSQQTHQVIEHIKHYNRFMSSYLPSTTSMCDALSHMSVSSLTMPNWLLYKQSVLDNPAQVLSPNSFCVPLPCGLFNGTANIPLSSTWGLKGLLIEIHLCPDTNFIHAGTTQGAALAAQVAPAGTTTGLADAHYELSDVKLVCEAINPSPEQLQAFPANGGTFEYSSISSYFTSINSTNAIINFNLGLKRVLGVFMNFVPSSRINSLANDGLATIPLINSGTFTAAQIQKVSFLRGGDKFPLEYDIDYLGKDGTTYKEADSQVMRNFINSFGNWAKNDRIITGVNNTFEIGNESTLSNFLHVTDVDSGQNFGVGIAYDVISDQGVDFSTQAWGTQITCGLTTDNPTAVYLFAHSKNTIAYNQSGLQVLS